MTDQGPDKRKGTPLYRQRVTCAECKGGNVQLNYFSNAVSLEGKWRTFAFLISRFQPPPFWALRNSVSGTEESHRLPICDPLDFRSPSHRLHSILILSTQKAKPKANLREMSKRSKANCSRNV